MTNGIGQKKNQSISFAVGPVMSLEEAMQPGPTNNSFHYDSFPKQVVEGVTSENIADFIKKMMAEEGEKDKTRPVFGPERPPTVLGQAKVIRISLVDGGLGFE